MIRDAGLVAAEILVAKKKTKRTKQKYFLTLQEIN